MTYQSKKALVVLSTNITIFFFVYLNHLNKLAANDANRLQLWGLFFLKLLGILILSNILVMILFNIINDLFSKNKAPLVSDERDRLIELRAVRNFCFLLSFGFFLSMGALALNQSASMMFTILAFTVLASDIISYLSYIFYYQRGY